jgi:hypothetical protein
LQRGAPVLALSALIFLAGMPVMRYYAVNDLTQDHEARDFVANTLAQAADGSVLLTATDRPTFALWYAIYGLHMRPDVMPLNVNLYAYDWSRETLARRYPAVFATADKDMPLEKLLVLLAARHSVYRVEALPVAVTDFADEPAGVLTRMRLAP